MRLLFCYLIFAVVRLRLARCQGFGGGGPGSFGYDASSACSKPYSRTAKARFENLPCDFRRQNWCTVAGSAYPWHAVRRFVQENQGLMRRMYGEETHFSVLRAELEKNDVELEIDDEYRDNTADHSRSFHSGNGFEYRPEEEFVKNPELDQEFASRGFDDQVSRGKFSKVSHLEEFTKPHFRPTPASTTSTSSSPKPDETTTTSSTGTESTSSADQSPTEPLVKTSLSPVQVQNLSINEIPGQLDRIDLDVQESSTDRIVVEVESTTEVGTIETDAPARLIPDKVEDEPAIRNSQQEELSADQVSGSSVVNEEFRPRPEYKPADAKQESPGMEGQLFQDVAAKDQQPVLKLRGVNACPVKEEVVAPFWANNTRGEVLALLNLYPFEQYVHWEKCTNPTDVRESRIIDGLRYELPPHSNSHENKQMYCRDGCRCEQQYRLHRLLAYDPNNECRGIFSDWFKFPSCCVCRCYDLPVEFRVTSRSPRTQRSRPRTHDRISSEWYRHEI